MPPAGGGSSATASSSSRPPPPLPPLPPATAAPRRRAERWQSGVLAYSWRLKLECLGVLISAAMQAAYLVRQLDIASPSENFHMVLIVAFHAAILGTMVGPHPTLYARYRVPIYAISRPLGYLSPSVRSTRTAAAQLLAGGATPGLGGPLRDLLRLMLASRVLGTAVIGVIVVVPPALALAVQAVCTWLAAANAGYCATPMLADPLTRGRVAAAVGALDLLSLPLSVVAPQPEQTDPAAACSAFIFLLQLTVGVAAPLLFLARTEWKEPSLAPPPPSPPPQSTNASGQPKWKGLRLRAARAAAAANWAVWRCCSLPGSTSLLALWLGLSAAWTAALLRYGI